jgi:hypothetical protein
MNVEQSTIAELRKQRDELLADNAILRKRLASWPRAALNHALAARESERRRIQALTVPNYPVVVELIHAARTAHEAMENHLDHPCSAARSRISSVLTKLNS